MHTKFWSAILNGRDNLIVLRVIRNRILKVIGCDDVGPVAVCCEHGSECSGSIKGWKLS